MLVGQCGGQVGRRGAFVELIRLKQMENLDKHETHYSVEEIAKEWKFSRDSVRRIFLAEPDTLKITRPGSRYKRTYTTLRIPEHVFNRVYRRMCGGRLAA